MNSDTVNLASPPRTANFPARRPPPASLDAVVARVRRRWRARLLLAGLFRLVAVGGAAFVVAVWLLDHLHFAPGAIVASRLLLVAVLIALLYACCLRPLRRRVADARVALYLEEREPRLGKLVSSAIDARAAGNQDTSPQLARDLAGRAFEACAEIDYGDRVERPALRRAAARLALVAGALLALGLWPPEFLRLGAPALLMPWTSAAEYSPYRLELSPGDVEIPRGSDQLISLRIPGYDGGDVWLFTSPDGGVSWSQSTMAAGNAGGLYETFLFDVARDVDYFVRAAGQQTPTYRIGVVDIPVIETLRLRFHYPAYTRLEPEVFDGSGDITALVGTRVDVLVTPTSPIPGGALLLDDGSRIALAAGADGEWAGTIDVARDGVYRIQFARAGGAAVDASPEYRITALDDRRPGVSILSPGRDVKVSMVEEPVMRVRADDDQGVARLDLVLSVNGEPERRIPLLGDGGGESARVVNADHVLFLEELDLEPGDLISYYVQAEDRGPDGAARVATSDIFFYQVRPFSLNYRSAQQQGGGGGGGQGGQQQQGFLSEQQKQFVVATFKMIRDRDQYDDDAYRDNLDLLAKAQARIRDRVEAIVRRISRRPMNQLDEHYKVITAELPRAAQAMREVERQLKATEIEPALTDAQIALKHLQRADAAFRDINVALGNQNGGGSSGSNLEDLANLFQLEMDKLRNQYDSVQHARQQSPEQLIDETLERLRELARRQQRELERSLRRLGDPQTGNAERQRALAEELEEMARRLERLTRNEPNAQMQQSIQQMRDAAEAMRRAAEAAGGGGAQQAREAAERLRQAQRLLDQSRVAQFSDEVERTLRRAELAEKRQQAIREQVEELERQWGDRKKAQLRQIDERKQALNEELASLEGELNELTQAARSEQPEAGESLKQAIRAAREARLADRIGRTREMILLNQQQAAEDNERAIEQGIGRMRERIADALDKVDEPGRRGLERSLEAMRDLARELRTLRERAAERGAGGEGQDGREQRRAEAGGEGAGGRDARQPQRAEAGREGQSRGQPQAGRAGNATAGNAGERQRRGGASADAEGGGRGAFDGIVERAGEIGRSLRNHGVAAGDIDPVLAQIERLKRRDANFGEASEIALRALLELEFKLRQQLDSEASPDLLIADPRDLPDEYRDQVADYYRELSRP